MWCAVCGKEYENLTDCPNCKAVLSDFPVLQWGLAPLTGVTGDWPLYESGEPVSPAFLTHLSGHNLDDDLLVNLLSAYGFPCIRRFPNDGDFGRLILGASASGADIFVPETLLSDIKAFLEVAFDDEL